MSEIDVDALPEERRAWLSRMVDAGIISPCETPTILRPHQVYRAYPCRYKANAHWSITESCNFRCRHCLVSAPHTKFGHPTTEQLLDVVGQLAECGAGFVSLTGGEPLIRNDFWQVVDALCAHGIGSARSPSTGTW